MGKASVVERKLKEAEDLVKQQQQATQVQQAQVAQGTPKPDDQQQAPAPTPQPAPQPVPQGQQQEPIPAPDKAPQAIQQQQDQEIDLNQINDPMQLRQMLMADQSEMQKLQHKYDVLQGKYNAEVQRPMQRLKELEQDNAFLRYQLIQMQQNPAGLQASPHKSSTVTKSNDEIDLTQWYSQEEIDAYDADFLKGLVRNQIKLLEQQKHEFIEPVQKELQAQRFDMFENELRRLVADYDVLNNDTAFNDWLDQPEYEGESETRRERLKANIQRMNAAGVAGFFNRYHQQSIAQPAIPTNVHRQIAPVSSGVPQQQSFQPQQQKRTYSGTEYSALMSKAVTGQTVPGFANVHELKKELDLALREGRITG